jgi:hypothetical protein
VGDASALCNIGRGSISLRISLKRKISETSAWQQQREENSIAKADIGMYHEEESIGGPGWYGGAAMAYGVNKDISISWHPLLTYQRKSSSGHLDIIHGHGAERKRRWRTLTAP